MGFIHDKLDIKFLILYLMARVAGPVDFTTLADLTFCDDGVEYFDFAESVAELVSTGHLAVEGDLYTITDKGRKVAQELAYDLPRSVREKAVAAVLRSQTWARKEAEYSARISEKADGHCSVRCQVKALDSELFCLDIGTPDRLSAEMVKKQFILKGNEIYQMLITKLTEEEK